MFLDNSLSLKELYRDHIFRERTGVTSSHENERLLITRISD